MSERGFRVLMAVIIPSMLLAFVYVFVGSPRWRAEQRARIVQEGVNAVQHDVPVLANPYTARSWGDNREHEKAWLEGWMEG